MVKGPSRYTEHDPKFERVREIARQKRVVQKLKRNLRKARANHLQNE